MNVPRHQVTVWPTVEVLHRAAAEHIVTLGRAAIDRSGRFSLALSGGSTPKKTYQELAAHFATALPWEKVHVWWSDERCVPHDHPDSNARMATEALLQHVPVPAANIHRVPTHLTPSEAAAAYESDLRAFAASPLDLTLLGLGTDGHTASLFPGSPALNERSRWVVATQAPVTSPVRDRVTFTFPLIESSRDALFLVSGAEKLPLVQQLDRPASIDPSTFPAAMVSPRNGAAWFVDRAAAGT